ncbi:hypothetical protein DRO69_13360, partial [Candidatus Bathyarchaeota archaeon]
VYEKSLLWGVIRRKELAIILDNIWSRKPTLILDYGCGAEWLSAFLERNGAEFIVCGAERLPF